MKDISKSILQNILIYFLAQIVLFMAILFANAIPFSKGIYFYISAPVTHIIFFVFLLLQKDDFYLIEQKTQLTKVNGANLITMARVSTLPTITCLISLTNEYNLILPLIIITSLVFITDFLDGMIARKTKQLTRIGRYLDSMSDYALLICVSFLLLHFEFIPLWFFSLVMFRLLFQWAGMGLIMAKKGKAPAESTLLGKASVFATMFAYAFSLLQLALGTSQWLSFSENIVFYVTSAVVGVSVIDKWMYLSKKLKAAAE